MTGEGFKTFTEIFERQFISILKEKFSFFAFVANFTIFVENFWNISNGY